MTASTPPATEAGTIQHVSATTDQQLRALIRLSRDRLATADAVAAAKFFTGQPVDDVARESLVLEQGAADARSRGFDPTLIRRALRADIDANKHVQRGLLEKWRAHPETAPAVHPDLAIDVRPVLDRVDHELVDAVDAASTALEAATCAAAVRRIARQEGADLDRLHFQAFTVAVTGLCP